MEHNVVKTEDFLIKTNWQRKTYPLKLNLTDTQTARVENLIYQYKKATNKIIQIITKEYFQNHLRRLAEENIKEGQCPLCQKKKKLKFELIGFDFVKYATTKGKPNYKPVIKNCNKLNICEMCHCSHYSLRKFLLPSSKRDIPIKQWDFTKDINLGKSSVIYDSCLQKAVECIKSQVEIKKKIDWKIKFYRERIIDNTVKLNQEDDKENKFKDKELIKKLKNYIRYDTKNIDKEKKKVSDGIIYKNDAIRLYDNSYKLIQEDGDFFIKFKDYSKDKWLTFSFYGKKYQKVLAEKFIKSKNAETEIIRKGDDFFLQYIYRKESDVPIPNKNFTAIGIDVNIINLASYTCIKENSINFNTKFYSGRRMRKKRKRFNDMRAIWNKKRKYSESGGKGRSKKWFLRKVESQNEKNYVKYIIHNITTEIVQDIKENVLKPVIILENLKDIRDRIGNELKISKCSIEKLNKDQQKKIRADKLLNSELNNWNFDDFQKFIEYKANWLGIPVVYVKAKDTSIKCNKCGNIDPHNYTDYHKVKFKCSKCNYKCNSDFNASVNIARRFYEDLNNTK